MGCYRLCSSYPWAFTLFHRVTDFELFHFFTNSRTRLRLHLPSYPFPFHPSFHLPHSRSSCSICSSIPLRFSTPHPPYRFHLLHPLPLPLSFLYFPSVPSFLSVATTSSCHSILSILLPPLFVFILRPFLPFSALFSLLAFPPSPPSAVPSSSCNPAFLPAFLPYLFLF